ncbi:hypothetical protein Pelo_18478 [Pelomyxa schiedti]|nr:hypothetical protein Pelo_18478 [Pelomyxa schiedti]
MATTAPRSPASGWPSLAHRAHAPLRLMYSSSVGTCGICAHYLSFGSQPACLTQNSLERVYSETGDQLSKKKRTGAPPAYATPPAANLSVSPKWCGRRRCQYEHVSRRTFAATNDDRGSGRCRARRRGQRQHNHDPATAHRRRHRRVAKRKLAPKQRQHGRWVRTNVDAPTETTHQVERNLAEQLLAFACASHPTCGARSAAALMWRHDGLPANLRRVIAESDPFFAVCVTAPKFRVFHFGASPLTLGVSVEPREISVKHNSAAILFLRANPTSAS